MERHAEVEDLYPLRKSVVSPRNNTGEEGRAKCERAREERRRIRGEREMSGKVRKIEEMRGNFKC